MKTNKQDMTQRRTQTERSDAMRERLVRATLDCLAEHGYNGTTLSAIVRQAGVSRGAQVHHFASKNELIIESARFLMRRAYRILGEILLDIANDDERLPSLLNAIWTEIFATQMFKAYFELIIASQHDAELAEEIRKLLAQTKQQMDQPIHHYFEVRETANSEAAELFTLTMLVMGGMSATAHISAGKNEAERLQHLWTQIMTDHIRARPSVVTPPARPYK